MMQSEEMHKQMSNIETGVFNSPNSNDKLYCFGSSQEKRLS